MCESQTCEHVVRLERDGSDDKANDHTRGREDHDLATADDVYVFQCEEREDEVRAGDDQADGNGVVEANLLKEGC